MLASRLLSLLMLLQSRGRMSAPALARQLEVSVRTVYRDIDSLSAAGVPVYGDPGRNGGYQLRDGWRTQLTGLTPGEARALLLTGLPGPAKALGLGEAAASAHLKLMAALPGDWQADAERVGSRFHLDPVDWFRGAAPADHLRDVAQAVWNEQRLRMRYESWTEVAEREIEPLGLVLKAGAWYVVGRRARVVRTYKLANMHDVQVLRQRFQRPREFDLAAYWADATQRFEEGVYRDFAALRVSAAGLQRLQGFSPLVAQAAQRTAGTPDAQGWITVTVPIESIEHAAREMLRLGPEAEVLQPAPLRARMRALLAQMNALYAQARAVSRPSPPSPSPLSPT
jgi:predicted DNA-binding transcriptional regulator YafY